MIQKFFIQNDRHHRSDEVWVIEFDLEKIYPLFLYWFLTLNLQVVFSYVNFSLQHCAKCTQHIDFLFRFFFSHQNIVNFVCHPQQQFL